jgi:hypothetical protein
MMKNLLFCISVVVLLHFAVANADDTAFGGSGALPFPIKQSGVKMVNDYIALRGNDINRKNFKGAWHVTCLFTFKNTRDKILKFRMGFPLPVRERIGEIATPYGYSANVGDPLVYDFSVWVNGVLVPVKRYKIAARRDKEMYYKHAYIWNIVFAPKQTLKIRHEYSTGITVNALGHSYASYVLKTGAMWQGGKIGYMKIEVIPNVPTRMCRELPARESQYFESTPPGVKIIGSKANRKYVWDLKNFHPTKDFDLCLQTGQDYLRYRFIYKIIDDKTIVKKLTKAKLNLLKNMIFAQYGRVFKNPKLQAYFDKQWWYVRNPSYSNAMLSKDDKKAIAIIINQIKH